MCTARQNALLIYWIVHFFFPCFIVLAGNILAVAFDELEALVQVALFHVALVQVQIYVYRQTKSLIM